MAESRDLQIEHCRPQIINIRLANKIKLSFALNHFIKTSHWLTIFGWFKSVKKNGFVEFYLAWCGKAWQSPVTEKKHHFQYGRTEEPKVLRKEKCLRTKGGII